VVVRVYGLDWSIAPIWFLAMIESIFGRPALAASWEKCLFSLALANPHPYTKAIGIFCVTLSLAVRGAWQQVSETVSLINPICEEFGFPEIAALAKLLDGRANFWRAKQQGMVQIAEAIGELDALGCLILSVWGFALLAETQIEAQTYEAASASVAEGLKNLNRTKAVWCESEVYRLAGDIARQMPDGNRDIAENQYRKAIDVAQRQSFKWWELRATTALARLLRDTNRRDEARTMLGEIYNWFTEGFDLRDLKEAKAMLEELGGTLQ
jgi:hypothetical protein